jgi:hypothetical protein
MCCGCECTGAKRACAGCRACVHRFAPVMRALSLVSGLLMTVGGGLGAVSLNPFTLLHGFFLAILGICVIGGEFSWAIVLDRAPFLSSYAGKGVFFLYIALPLVEDGWAEYKNCVLWWRDLPCPSTPPDVDPPGNWLARLLTQSVLVQFAVGLALTVAGVLKLLFAATGPPPSHTADGSADDVESQQQPTLQSRRGSEATEPLIRSGEKGPLYAAVEEPLSRGVPGVPATTASIDDSVDASSAAGQDVALPTATSEQAAAAEAAAAGAQLEVGRLKEQLASVRRSQQAAAETRVAETASASATGTTYAQQQQQALLANLST